MKSSSVRLCAALVASCLILFVLVSNFALSATLKSKGVNLNDELAHYSYSVVKLK